MVVITTLYISIHIFSGIEEKNHIICTPVAKIIFGVCRFIDQGPVVQSITGLTSSLRGQLVKCFTAL